MKDNWKTPTWLKTFFNEYYDPCLLETNTIHPIDTLGSSWGSPAFVNPPYSNPLPWVKKAIEEAKQGVDVVMLLNVDPSTQWYLMLIEANAHFCYFNERLKFDDIKSASDRPSMLVFLSSNSVKVKEIKEVNLNSF
jgi:hypothetical protein